MSQKLIIILCALAFGIGLASWNTTPPSALVESNLTEGKTKVKNFAFTSIDGRKRVLSDFHGKTVFINSWFTHCPPCIAEMPQLLQLAQKHSDDMVFIALSIDRNVADLQRYLSRLPRNTRALTEKDNVFFVHDDGNIISGTMLGVKGFPQTIIVNHEGHQLQKIKGAIDWLSPKVEKIFSEQPLPDVQPLKHTNKNAK